MGFRIPFFTAEAALSRGRIIVNHLVLLCHSHNHVASSTRDLRVAIAKSFPGTFYFDVIVLSPLGATWVKPEVWLVGARSRHPLMLAGS